MISLQVERGGFNGTSSGSLATPVATNSVPGEVVMHAPAAVPKPPAADSDSEAAVAEVAEGNSRDRKDKASGIQKA